MKPVGPTRPRDLALAAAGTAVLGYLLVRSYYGDIPALPWTPSVALAGLAVFEGGAARGTRQRIARRPGTKPVEPLVVARLVALAKASALVGALLVGFWAGAFAYTFGARDRLAAAGRDAVVAGVGVAVCALLVGAALWLENSCRAPDPPEDPPAPA
ncbi:MAG: DUF3180 domain-containing protein [Actinomycetota bacterium]|nr:DUF3180 domain-containing protein [Actinomycetota bacterium]